MKKLLISMQFMILLLLFGRSNIFASEIKTQSLLNLKYDVTTSAESDYYIAVAIDGAGNISKKYIIPQICMSNRIRRYILHDNYEEQYGYYRIYE